MDWLRAYEGERGVAYLFAIVGIFAPTILALYLLAPSEFITTDWPKLILFSAAVGGMLTAMGVLATAMQLLTGAMVAGEEGTREVVNKQMLHALTLGSIYALFFGSFTLGFCILTSRNFREFVLTALAVGSGYVALHFFYSCYVWKEYKDEKKKSQSELESSTRHPNDEGLK